MLTKRDLVEFLQNGHVICYESRKLKEHEIIMSHVT
jgi:hypothetical protein